MQIFSLGGFNLLSFAHKYLSIGSMGAEFEFRHGCLFIVALHAWKEFVSGNIFPNIKTKKKGGGRGERLKHSLPSNMHLETECFGN